MTFVSSFPSTIDVEYRDGDGDTLRVDDGHAARELLLVTVGSDYDMRQMNLTAKQAYHLSVRLLQWSVVTRGTARCHPSSVTERA